ncbi:MAG: J domain-containing protein, partial [Candidatus Methylumidiphilus sp.]
MAKDYYEILQIHPNAEPEVIRAAYKRLIQKYHPDKNPVEQALAERRTEEITKAYAVLSNPERRSLYDRSRTTAGPDNAEAERRKVGMEMENARRAKAEAQQAQRRAEQGRRQAEARAREAEEARRRAEARARQAEADSRAQQAAAEARRRVKASWREGFGVTGWLTLVMAAFGLAIVAWGIVYSVMQSPPAETATPQ